jgi:hypothetical protein
LLPRIPDLVPKNIDTIHLFHREEIPQWWNSLIWWRGC